jgi:ATP-dependent helicase/nuclease subunit A
LNEERRRVVYVAATRARDLLIIPKAGDISDNRLVCKELIESAPPKLVQQVPEYRDGTLPKWAREIGPRPELPRTDSKRVESDVAAWWIPAAIEAARPRFRPVSVTGGPQTSARDEIDESDEAGPQKPRESRFGQSFGTTVHQAIDLMLSDPGLKVEAAVRRSAQRTGLVDYLDDAAADVARALETLRAEGLARTPGPDFQMEYPVAAAWEDGQLMTGYLDLVAATDDRLDVIDFKTDAVNSLEAAQARARLHAPQLYAYRRAAERLFDASPELIRTRMVFLSVGASVDVAAPSASNAR